MKYDSKLRHHFYKFITGGIIYSLSFCDLVAFKVIVVGVGLWDNLFLNDSMESSQITTMKNLLQIQKYNKKSVFDEVTIIPYLLLSHRTATDRTVEMERRSRMIHRTMWLSTACRMPPTQLSSFDAV